MSEQLLRPKLENIISGHNINNDDADWLRAALAQPAEGGEPIAEVHASWSDDEGFMIAASPNLLKALCMWMDIHKTPAGFAGKYGKELDAAIAAQQLRIDAAVSASLEAIAKATGATHDN